jgi:anaerobic magnesium-protoporphyrin IX monomethyl ester cyclase
MRRIRKVLFVMASAKTIAGLSGKIAVPPAGMLSIAGYARQFFPHVEFLLRDFGAERLPLQQQIDVIKHINPDIIGMAARSFIYPATVRLATEIKKALPLVKIIFGGHHPTLMPEGTEYPLCFDVVVRHEGEQAFVDLMRLFESGVPWPLFHSSAYLEELSHHYAWDTIQLPQAYARFYSPFNTDPMGSVVWSRGCPFDCLFCSGPALWKGSKPRVRYRSPESVVHELRELYHRFGVRRFFVHDDTLNANLGELVPILEEIIRSNLKMTWGAAGMRANEKMTPTSLFPLLREAGCRYICYGIESGDPDVLRKLNRQVSFAEIERALSLTKQHGMRTAGGFTLGHIWLEEGGQLGGEREEHLGRTLSYMKHLIDHGLLWSFQLSIIDPIPGSKLWEIANQHGLLECDDWENLLPYDRVRLNFRHPFLSRETVDHYYRKGYRLVGMNPGHALRLLLTVRSMRDMWGLVRTGIFVWRKRIYA